MASKFKPKKKNNRVIVYSTPTCSYCNMAKQYFQQKNVRFKDVDVSQNQAAARDLVRRTGQMGVPVIQVGSEFVVGFDKPKINALLNL